MTFRSPDWKAFNFPNQTLSISRLEPLRSPGRCAISLESSIPSCKLALPRTAPWSLRVRTRGKTETARQRAASEVLLDIDAAARQAAAIDPALVLAGDVPRLIDEWQVVRAIWNQVRRAVDERATPGQFILTGSATPADDQTRHTGAMRFGRVRMRPMTLSEVGRSTREVSLAGLMRGEPTRSPDPGLTIHDLIDEVVMGGWPGIRHLAVRDAARAVRDYLDQIRRTDIQAVDGVTRDPERVQAVFRSLARNVATQAALTKIAADARTVDDTVASYLTALSRLMIVEDQPAWNTHLRSSHRLRTTPTRHFVDPSLAVAALRTSPTALLDDLEYFGFVFESLVVRDLRVYAQALDGEVLHYRDQSGLEVDAIIDARDRWGAFEVKLGTGQVETAAQNLAKFAARIDTSKRGEPAVLGVIVGSGFGYVRPDGIHVIPIGALAP
jgi:predicted AAA+ superfamily ATPase